MASYSKISEYDEETPVAQVPNRSNGGTISSVTKQKSSETAVEAVEELVGSGDYAGVEFGDAGIEAQVDEATELDNHRPLSSPPAGPASQGVADESEAYAGDTESFYESLEGFDESSVAEAGESDEALVEAAYADGGDPEFFAALVPALLPIVKSVLPTIASAVAQQGAKSMTPHLQALLGRLTRLGLRPATIRREAGDGEGAIVELDEAFLGEAEAQIATLEVVIGRDDRVQVKNTKLVPWNRICHLKITAANGKSFLGTGFLVGRRTVITAGHCVHIASHGGWVRQIVVTPGRNAAEAPYDSMTATSFRSVRGWVNHKQRNYDYGAIILPRSVPTTLGAFGFANYPDADLLNKRLNISGYDGDKPAGTQWFQADKAKAVTARTIVYTIDTAGGKSGAPVWLRQADGKRIVVGIHTNGLASGNSATRITKPVFANLKRWRTEGGA